MDETLVINRQLSLPQEELSWRFTRAAGAGGQNVNRVSTRVELSFDIAHSPSLSEEQRTLLLEHLGKRLDNGVLHIVEQSERSQWRNRQRALGRLRTVLRSALNERRARQPSRVPYYSRELRLQAKRHSKLRRSRREIPGDD